MINDNIKKKNILLQTMTVSVFKLPKFLNTFYTIMYKQV